MYLAWFSLQTRLTEVYAVYQVATVDSHNLPHVRSQIHRGFITPKGSPNLPLLMTSTDARSPKVVQMLSTPSVELAWWMEGSQDQFRISGRAFIVPPPDHAFHIMSDVPRGTALAVLDEKGEEGQEGGKFDWEKKRREVFASMKPEMKASWCIPVAPGSIIPSYDEVKKWPNSVPNIDEASTAEDKNNWNEALSNFVLMVIEPVQVDWVQLAPRPNRRTRFSRTDDAVFEWIEDILVP